MNGNFDLLRLFGRAVRERRSELGISQEQLAMNAGMDRTYVGGIERGERNPSLQNIARLADALQLATSELLKRSECDTR